VDIYLDPSGVACRLSLSASTGSSVTSNGTPTTGRRSQGKATIKDNRTPKRTNTITRPSIHGGSDRGAARFRNITGPGGQLFRLAISGGSRTPRTPVDIQLHGCGRLLPPSLPSGRLLLQPGRLTVATSSGTPTQNLGHAGMNRLQLSETDQRCRIEAGKPSSASSKNGCTNGGSSPGQLLYSSIAGRTDIDQRSPATTGGCASNSYTLPRKSIRWHWRPNEYIRGLQPRHPFLRLMQSTKTHGVYRTLLRVDAPTDQRRSG